ncbi:uncharacterized protein LOC128678602 isoform X2 [Plodia interpunctella]|uniref:uncharacterized protein LOC128678602 isoform X2 n=1 Tax=Plodia interpunctella TaxID=58824 RepID=UPI002367B559|nr:uncharacterized protein LOC128678602 isoform X2 [Plodia interpunctella]
MNQIDQNINKDMIDSDLIDVESLDFSDNQTWLCIIPDDSGNKVDIVDWNLSCDWPVNEDIEYQKLEKDLFTTLDSIIKNEIYAMPDKHKFDSRTYVRPKRRPQRPSIQSIVEVSSNPPSISPSSSLNSSNKYLTYNKYSMPLGPVNPMLRLKTFNVDVNTDNSNSVKEYAMKRRSLVQDEDPQLEDLEMPSPDGDRLAEHTPTKPINIDLSQPAHNLHNTFNKGLTNMMNERGSLNMYQSGESLMRMSPPSLVSSLLMESSGTFYPESLESKKCPPHRDAGPPTIGRESIDPMMTSMTLSILDEKDMSTSFLSQTTYPDNDSLMDSLPPSLVSSVNSSYVVSNTSKPENIFSSATFTHLEQTERLLSSRPRAALYNSFKRESMPRNSESYTKSKEQAVQIDGAKILNENCDKKDSSKSTPKTPEMTETITLHYSNNKFRKDNDAEKENLNATFQQDDAFFKDMGMQKVDLGRNSLNVTLDKQELNEIIQARQKLSLARKALPTEPDKVDTSPIKTIQLPNQTITVPRQSMENASELLSRRRMNGGFDRHEEPTRETPKRNATFKKVSPSKAMDTTVVFVKDEQMIDINSATLNLIDSSERTLQQEEWGSQERAMVGSSESTDTGTFSSSSPPESTVDTEPETRLQVASTPLMSLRKGSKNDLLNIHSTISPIYDMVDDKSYTLTKVQSPSSGMERTYDMHNATVVNTATMVKKSAKRDILAPKGSPEKKIVSPPHRSPPSRISPINTGSYTTMAPPSNVPRKTNLPTSKLRQYSSHRELSRIPGGNPSGLVRPSSGKAMIRRNVYASNPALSPTASVAPPIRRDSYTVTTDAQKNDDKPTPVVTAPPALVRQGTETLRRERPQSQLVAPRELRVPHTTPAGGVSIRSHQMPPPTSRPYSVAGTSHLRVATHSRLGSVPIHKPAPATQPTQPTQPAVPRPQSSERASALPRPSRLPARRPSLRPPSVYSVAPTADVDHY